jgi:Glycosyl hydrolases family 8
MLRGISCSTANPGTEPTREDGQALYYQLTPDMAYVEDIGNQDVRTEGMGYAMMIAVQTDHQYEFDSLWYFAKTKMQLQSGPMQYLFAWHTDTSGNVLATGVAPDSDLWIAAALSLASDRWGDGSGVYDYGQQAEQILHAMWHESDTGGVNMFDATSYLPILSAVHVLRRNAVRVPVRAAESGRISAERPGGCVARHRERGHRRAVVRRKALADPVLEHA